MLHRKHWSQRLFCLKPRSSTININLCGLIVKASLECQKDKEVNANQPQLSGRSAGRAQDKCYAGSMSVLMWCTRVMFWWVGEWLKPAREGGGAKWRGSCQGALSHAEGLALLADRWRVYLSLQFVFPGSPASSHISCPEPQSGSESGLWWTIMRKCVHGHVSVWARCYQRERLPTAHDKVWCASISWRSLVLTPQSLRTKLV